MSTNPTAPRAPAPPLYVELAPLGPTDAGDSAGTAQMSTAYVRRFTRPLDGGSHYAVIDVECYAVNAAANDDEPARPVLSRSYGYTVCANPADPSSTEVNSYTSYDPDIEHIPGQPPFTDEDAYRLCAEVDPATLTWDGRPDPEHPYRTRPIRDDRTTGKDSQ